MKGEAVSWAVGRGEIGTPRDQLPQGLPGAWPGPGSSAGGRG